MICVTGAEGYVWRCEEFPQFIDVTRARAHTRNTSLYASASLHLRAIEIANKFRTRQIWCAGGYLKMKEIKASTETLAH